MKKHFWIFGLVALLFGSFVFTACEDEEEGDPSIYKITQDDSNFSSLRAALERTGLDDVLNGSGTFTVFAPTNAAFSAFLTANGFASLDAVPTDLLENVLLYHVLAAQFLSTDLSDGYVSTQSPSSVDATAFNSLLVTTSGGVRLNGTASVSTADVKASNGVVHVISEVLFPPTVVDLALDNSNFSSLVAALTRAGLPDYVTVLSGDGPFTVFAPTNQAFQNLLDSNPAWSTLNDIPLATLQAVLEAHVVSGVNARSAGLSNNQTVPTIGGANLTVSISGGNVSIAAPGGSANVAVADVQGSNGVVHAIDAVLLP